MTIQLTDAAKYYKAESHQIAAWNYLQSELSAEQLDEFAVIYRAGPSTPTPTKATIITPLIMQQLTGYPATSFDNVFCDDFNKLLKISGFDKHKKEMCMLTANLMHETGNFKWLKEIASGEAYNGRTDLGNTQPGDGPKFKGAGVLMLTGRANYTDFEKYIGDPKVTQIGCDYVADTYPFVSAIAWIENNRLLDICLTKGFDECCYRINGGWNGYEDRKAKYEIALNVFDVQ